MEGIYTLYAIILIGLFVLFEILRTIVIKSLKCIERKNPKLFFILRAKLNKKIVKDLADKELADAKKHTYATFEEFLQDCPKYQLETGFLADWIRKIYQSSGVDFQQFVFIDKNSPSDKTAWLRHNNLTVIHGKGTYVLPWKSEKKIIYYDLIDARPLIDLSEDAEWKNPDMCADVVTAITNSHLMESMDGQKQTAISMPMLILMGMIAIIGFLMLYNMFYLQDKQFKEQMEILKIIANQTALP